MLKETCVVFCLYSYERFFQNEKKFKTLFELFVVYGVDKILFVDNSGKQNATELNTFVSNVGDIEVIQGSNNYAEFSAWQEGIEYISSNEKEPSLNYILINDTAFSHFKLFTWKVLNFLFQVSRKGNSQEPVVMGEQVKLRFISSVLGMRQKHFIRTALFYINSSASRLFIENCNTVFEKWETEAEHHTSSFDILKTFFSESSSYHIGCWLFASGWYGSKPFEDFDKQLLKYKITAIANEHAISAACLKYQGDTIDTNIQRNFDVKEQATLFFKMVLPKLGLILRSTRTLKS